jgi:hypothetical protein
MKLSRPLRNLTCALALVGFASPVLATPNTVEKPVQPAPLAWSPAVKAKALSATVERGLDWLVKHQLGDGGWGQGEESPNMGRGMQGVIGNSNVADTAMATLTLLRSGSTPSAGSYAKNINRGLDFVLGQIEASDEASLWVTSVRGTRVQGKIGPYVGTFLSAQLLAEVSGQMASPVRNTRVKSALAKVLGKMEHNQRADGGYTGGGWAPVLSQALAVKGTNRAFQRGAKVSEKLRDRSAKWAASKIDKVSGRFSATESAGVALYGTAATVGGLGDSVASDELEEADLREAAEHAPTAVARTVAKTRLARAKDTKEAQKAAQSALVARMSDQSFINGFGSNGGEEFLSYMLVSESLVAKGGAEWNHWDQAMIRNLAQVQNGNGSWTGHHCITGRTFCTS